MKIYKTIAQGENAEGSPKRTDQFVLLNGINITILAYLGLKYLDMVKEIQSHIMKL